MKKILLTILLVQALFLTTILNAQSVYLQDFSSATNSSLTNAGWIISNNTQVQEYYNPSACSIKDKGLGTPGVGKNAPMGILLPAMTYDASKPYLLVNFELYVYRSNDVGSNCTVQPFQCTTVVEAYIVPTSWNKETTLPTGNQAYASLPGYQIVYPNANNTVAFNNISMPNGVTQYRILLNFKSSNGDCTSNGIKYVFDDFNIVKSSCSGTCTPVTNSDYFNSTKQSFGNPMKGNVYGGYAPWASNVSPGFEMNSLSELPATNSGTDYDFTNPALSQMTFTLINPANPLTVEANTGTCIGTPNPGTLAFSSDGTFTYTRGSDCVTRVSFTYKTRNTSTNLESNTSKVTIDLAANVVLPVHFQSFTAYRNPQRKEQVLLKWETASEQNNRGFNVQRKLNGQWKNIAFVFSQADNGNSNTGLAYEYKEINTAVGTSQYQIQQVDFDGKTSYSEVKSVVGVDQKTAVQVYPNPAVDGKVNLLFKETNSPKDIIVNDVNGRIVKLFKEVWDNNLTIEGLQSGFYTIKITDRRSSETIVEKVVIKK
ncbi:T9SS type A sorting domain-containing protein [Chitinophagaceae bacterium LB-8]|uniref:T9SS type A sorting domain-containing protein n=1 Tax=Paraflavisolibacter caeni TaxID=2982496 RepID=A0A9X2XSL4_9BACT|nr:T9SS type A sorting domain-containing protein [Paraflavisolibacter caeni]MCU7547487.1 T9SS type A sorting domain-containing protein [Paraflavisolibacter caeni]